MVDYVLCKRILVLLVAILLFDVSGAFAAGTLAGTSIPNTATVTFNVGGTPQVGVASTTAFLVDRKINLTVATSTGLVPVAPGSTDQVMAFTVTNNSNAPLDFSLLATNATTTDQFSPTSIRSFVESGLTPGYQVGEDTATFMDEIPADAMRVVYIVANIPAGEANNNTASMSLAATAAEAGGVGLGAPVGQTGGADTAGVDTVFADLGAAGASPGDASRDGRHSAVNSYVISTAVIAVVKTATIISDPFNGTTNPKAIPGAVIAYCIQITNPAGGATATDVTMTDPIPVSTTYVANSIFAGGTTCSNGTAVTDATGFNATPAPGTVTTIVSSVPAGTTVTSRFHVTID